MSTVFLITFFVGFGLTVISVVLGAIDLSGLGHGAGHGGIDGGVQAGHGDAGDLGHGAHGDASGHAASVSPVNFQTLVAFLMGFGGVGYLVSRYPVAGLLLAIPAAIGGGTLTGWLILKWLRFLVRNERPMLPSNYLGVVGKLTVGIRDGGTGELVYTLHGTRMVTAARSSDGRPIAKGQQVVILRYEKGMAYVEPFTELMDDRSEHS
ncbi:MAG TPA: hypothetical protein VNT01_15570 [Symbiobacteriaceae bacterium]|nr:hypothetical protein [Symbiobacteriaceae bacterium]